MSWNDYVTYMTTDNVCESAYIIGKDGTLWAGTSNNVFSTYNVEIANETDGALNVKISIDEKKNFFNALANEGVCKEQGGIRIAGEKYFSTHFDGEKGVWYIKKNGGGACVAQTNQGILIGVYNSSKMITSSNSPQNPGATNKVVEALQEMLKGANF